MHSPLYVGLSAQMALQKRMETLAHNVANANTAGFRSEEIRFEALLAQAGDKEVAFASTGDVFLSRRAGGHDKTGNPLDVAVDGDGWMAFQSQSGTVYTRDGRLSVGAGGTLQTINKQPVLDAGGAPITIDMSQGPVAIAHDGMITQGGRQVGAIGLFSIDQEAKLTRAEGSGVTTDRPAAPILDFTRNGLSQGYVEKANVDPIADLTRLIAVQRTFEAMTAGVEATESSVTDAIKTLGSTS